MKNKEIIVRKLAEFILAEDEGTRRKIKKDLKLALNAAGNVGGASKNPEYLIIAVLMELGTPDSLVGYPYVVKAVEMTLDDRSYIDHMTHAFYPRLAVIFDTTASRVERAIRHVVEVIWTRGSYEAIDRYFGNTVNPNKGKPTNGEFIARLANIIRMQMQE